jgi:hypothetical protein
MGDANLVMLTDHSLKTLGPELVARVRLSNDLRLPFDVGLPGTPTF